MQKPLNDPPLSATYPPLAVLVADKARFVLALNWLEGLDFAEVLKVVPRGGIEPPTP
jgi:hypothetical protein